LCERGFADGTILALPLQPGKLDTYRTSVKEFGQLRLWPHQRTQHDQAGHRAHERGNHGKYGHIGAL
jgi:hypothetical protein